MKEETNLSPKLCNRVFLPQMAVAVTVVCHSVDRLSTATLGTRSTLPVQRVWFRD